MESGTFSGVDGVTIFYRKWKTEEPRGVVVVSHGLGEHGGRYAELAEYLCDNGFSCAAMDHRGHGKSTGSKGHTDSFDVLAADLETFLGIAGGDSSSSPVFLLGHSLGGLLALYLVLEQRPGLDGLIISAPPLQLRLPIPAIKVWAGKLLSGIIPALALNNEIDPDMLSTDAKTVEDYKNDPLVHPKISARMFTEMLAATERVNSASIESFPESLFIQGEDDPIVDPAGIRSFQKKVGNKVSKMITYPGFLHESLNESDRRKVYTDILEWLEHNSKRPVSA